MEKHITMTNWSLFFSQVFFYTKKKDTYEQLADMQQ